MIATQVSAAVLLIALTLWTQCGGIAALVIWARAYLARDIERLGFFHAAAQVVRLMAMVVVLHGFEILMWASFYRSFCLHTWATALYFSASSYATVGYGDVILPAHWRMFGPLESISGVLMCGTSVSVLFAIVTRLISRDIRLSRT